MQTNLKIAVGSDLAGYDYKEQVVKILRENGYTVTNVGCDSSFQGIYPIYAKKVAVEIKEGRADRGILICGTGQGMAIAANKIEGIRAALCGEIFTAIMSREHNNTNVLALGAWVTPIEKAMPIVEAWLFGKYSGRHDDKLTMLDNINML